MSLLEKIFGTHSDHELKRIYPIVDRIEAMDEDMQKLTDEELAARPMTPVTRDRQVSKALKAYASMVSSADKGAVRLIE